MSKHRYCRLTCSSIVERRAANTNQPISNQPSHAIPSRIVAIILGLSVSGLIGISFIVPSAIATPLSPNSVQQNESTDRLNDSQFAHQHWNICPQ
ncbi:MAG: hypothetical protein AB4050_04305 [Synechococcus sp.]